MDLSPFKVTSYQTIPVGQYALLNRSHKLPFPPLYVSIQGLQFDSKRMEEIISMLILFAKITFNSQIKTAIKQVNLVIL